MPVGRDRRGCARRVCGEGVLKEFLPEKVGRRVEEGEDDEADQRGGVEKVELQPGL